MSKQKKKSWKEKQRDRQLKEKNAQKTYQQQREQAEKSKPRKLPKGKIILGIVIIFIVIGAYVIIQTPTTKPFETIYIRADGTIDPAFSSVSKISNNQYTLLDDIYGSIVIEKNNIVLDGANYVLNGDNKALSHGIDLTEHNNVIIKNLEITNFGFGVYLFLSSNNTISQNNLSLNTNGIWLEYSSTNEIIENELSNQYAITLNYSPKNSISGNIISDCDGGIGLVYSSNNEITTNKITESLSAIGLASYSLNNNISGNIISDCDGGIALSGSSENFIIDNELGYGFGGIGLTEFSLNNTISNNQIEYFDKGILLHQCPSNQIAENSISNCGVGFDFTYSFSNILNKNTVRNSQQYGISLISSEDNLIFHNVFSENTNQVFSSESVNYWDAGYPNGGNYWSDYEELYPYSEEIESSGIWTESYQINESEHDNYPLINQ